MAIHVNYELNYMCALSAAVGEHKAQEGYKLISHIDRLLHEADVIFMP